MGAEETKEFKEAVIFSDRSEIREVVRQEVKGFGIKVDSIHYTAKLEDCIQLLNNREALIILDWHVGAESIMKVVDPLRSSFKIEMAPILLIANEMSDKILGMSAEFGISHAHIGDVSRASIKSALNRVFQDVRSIAPIKVLLRKVAEARRSGDYGSAVSILKKLLEKDLDNPRIITEIADIYVQLGEWDRALVILDRFRDGEPPDARGLHLLGRCLMKKGKFEDAANIYKRAKIMNPYNIERLISLGSALLNTDQLDEAKDVFGEALAMDKTNHDAAQGMGTTLLMQGEVDEALQLLRYISSSRELASVFNNAAILSMRQGRGKEGLSLYSSAIHAIGAREQEILARVYYNMGIGHYRMRNVHEAKRCFIRACELDPSYENAKHNVGVVVRSPDQEFARTGTDGQYVPVVGNKSSKSPNDFGLAEESIKMETSDFESFVSDFDDSPADEFVGDDEKMP